MLRDKNLVPLSRQHQHALAMCVRIDRASLADLENQAWQVELQQIFEGEISVHFAAEEKDLFPSAARYAELVPMVNDLLAEHVVLREYFAKAVSRSLASSDLKNFGEALSAHIRKEERQLFEGMQRLMSEQELGALGQSLDHDLAGSVESCAIPSEATRIRGK